MLPSPYSFFLSPRYAALTPSTDNTGLRIAAVAASAPFLIDTLLITGVPVYDLEKREGRNLWRGGTISNDNYYIASYLCCVGWDALAGYTFARVARNYGEYPP